MALRRFAALALVALAVPACGDTGHSAAPAPSASALVAQEKAATAQKLTIDTTSSDVSFLMDAPQEKIRGRVSKSTTGELAVDPTDLKKSTGLISIDIAGIEVFQTKADDEGKFGDEVKNDLQNTHVRAWLEIGEDAPETDRKKNARVEFAIRSVDKVSEADLTKLSGNERKVQMTVSGDLLLHQRKTPKTAELEATFRFEGDKLLGVSVKTLKPVVVGLAEHDVRPRESFGKLAQKTLEILAPKVAKEAPIEISFQAHVGDKPMPVAEPAAEAAPSASASADAAASAAPDASAAPAASAAPDASAAPAASAAP